MVFKQLHRGHFLSVGVLLYVPFSIFMPKAVAPLFVVVVLSSLVVHLSRFGKFPSLSRPFSLIFALGTGWAGASIFWSIIPNESISLFWPLGGTFLGGLVLIAIAIDLNNQEFEYFRKSIIVGFLIGIALLIVEIFTPIALTSVLQDLVLDRKISVSYTYDNFYKTGATVAAIAIWPFLALIWKKLGITWGILLLVSALVLFLVSHSNASFLALTVGILMSALYFMFGKKIFTVLIVLMWFIVLSAPFLADALPNTRTLSRVAPDLPDSVFPRIFIWKSAAKLVFESPIIGKGLDSARGISRNVDSIWFSGSKGLRTSVPIPLHPHNAILQIWLELGVIGAIALGFIFMLALRAISRADTNPTYTAATVGAMFTVLIIACVSYGIWQSWWQGVIWLTAANMAAVMRSPVETLETEKTPV